MIGRLDSSVLALFGIEARRSAALAATAITVSDAAPLNGVSSITEAAPEEAASEKVDDSLSFYLGLLDGTEDVLGAAARKMYGETYIRQLEASGTMFEGLFLKGANADYVVEADIADFPTRQAAMINAYHYAREATKAAQSLASFQSSDSNVRVYGDRLGREAYDREKDLWHATSMLTTQFGFEGSVMTTTDGKAAFAGVTVSHPTYGKLLSIDAKGGVTLYDPSGKAYGEEEYNAAQPDGVIPELWNVVNGKTNRLNVYV